MNRALCSTRTYIFFGFLFAFLSVTVFELANKITLGKLKYNIHTEYEWLAPRWEGGVARKGFPTVGNPPRVEGARWGPRVPEKKDVPTVARPRNILMGCKRNLLSTRGLQKLWS
jgi:hypothetical protein